MKYTVTFAEETYESLTAYLLSDRLVERAAYALCKVSTSPEEIRLLVRDVIRVLPEDILEASATGLKIASRSFVRAMKRADDTKQCFMFIHSHPEGSRNHSKRDDGEERELFRTAYNRIHLPGVHASLVVSGADNPVCRVWLDDGSMQPVSLIRIIGKRFRFFQNSPEHPALPVFFDRQVRAFGEDIQRVLSQLHIGVVGAGGTGSSIIEQLVRLGVGKLTIIDGQTFESTNVNRVYGSTVNDDGIDKVDIANRNSTTIGLGTIIEKDNKAISYGSSAKKLKGCDIIFGCTDGQWGRSILNKIAVHYLIPVFDMGVRIDSENAIVKSIEGRVTTLLGGYACLYCRGRINGKRIRAESMAELDPDGLLELQRQGYADELETTAPSVISFTTNVASFAISEFLHRLTGFMGEDRQTNEIIIKFDEPVVRRNNQRSKPECFCGQPHEIMRGDAKTFLDTTWRPE